MVGTSAATAVYTPVEFGELPGWSADDHSAALVAFRLSCNAITRHPALAAACIAPPPQPVSAETARTFFEQHFRPHRVDAPDAHGFLTAYYEPVVQGSRTPQPGFETPLHRRPPDLINLVAEADRASNFDDLTHARRTAAGIVPFPTREQIDRGAINGQGLELFYVADDTERFFLQVQGSGVIELPDGERVRITYDGKNGYPYTSVGRVLIEAGQITSDDMSLQTLAAWLRSDRERGRTAIWHNKSYVFFRELPDANEAVGVLGVALTPLRSLAIDPTYNALGTPIFIDAPAITHITGKPFRHLMVSQDVGSAIKGPARGDIYAGGGPEAGAAAGITKHAGTFYILLPRSDIAAHPGPTPSRPLVAPR